ncbi:MAG: hypothetical protein KAJ11_17965 [Alphaproteobacteria bacterium]|nr:hypothetical protein [Alphaproteobacteria bacterium]
MLLITGIFIGFLMGYSVPPMVEVGLIGGGDNAKVGLKSEMDEDLEEYYRSLSQEDGEGQNQ